jgi:signal peptidase II
MRLERIFKTLLMVAVLSSNIGCDQVSKHVARQKLEYHEQIWINKYVALIKVENTGAFLSLGDSWPAPVKTLLLTVIPLIVLVLATFYMFTRQQLANMTMIGISFIIGGGIGNIYDRIIYGSVTDFLHMDFILFRTGIFNLADVSVMTGVFIIFLDAWLNRRLKLGT